MKTPRFFLVPALMLAGVGFLHSRDLQPKPADPALERYEGWLAPETKAPLLQKGDRLAICGDSITEQRMYSVLMEVYVTGTLPELGVTCRQYGWSGEQASGFLNRMGNDVLRFKPTVATTCYGMNDHRYVPYTDEIGNTYRDRQTAIVKTFREAGTRVVLGSPGTISTVPGWVKSASGTWEDLNVSLCRLRNIDVEIAEAQSVAFADVFWSMLLAGREAQAKYGKDFALSGKDGVHPGWAGQVVMASAFLHGLGVTGEVGTVLVDMASGKAEATAGHTVKSTAGGKVTLESTKWPFCTEPGPLDRDDSIRAGMALAKFDERFNRLTLRVTGLAGAKAKVTWGAESKEFAKDALEQGINLAAEFPTNPFSGPSTDLWKAVAAKQDYETRQIKQLFHGPEGGADMEMTAALTEKAREKLANRVAKAHRPVEHVLSVEAL